MKKRLLWRLLISSTLIGIILSACSVPVTSGTPSNTLSLTQEGVFSVDPILNEFYVRLGGVDMLGPAISPPMYQNGRFMQFTEKVLLILDADSNTIQRYTLAPIGLQLDIFEVPRIPLADESLTDDGYPLYRDFKDTYTFFGARFTGKTLTNPILRTDLNRVEQYFENVAFVIDLTPGAQPQLLSYGSYECDFNCRYKPIEDSLIDLNLEIPPPFASAVDNLGINLVGAKEAGPYPAQDGHLEMVFSNMVLYYDEEQDRVFARDIAKSLGYGREAAPDANDPQNFVFYPTQGLLGYNVKVVGQKFITLHGGLDIMGLPVTEVFNMGGLDWQCFENICLIYDASQPEAFQVKPAALGKLYYGLTYDDAPQPVVPPVGEPVQNSVTAPSGLILHATEEFAFITPGTQQILHLEAFQQSNPLANAILTITLNAPDTETLILNAPPINENGAVTVTLPIIPVPNDTLVTYSVCLDNVCVESTFLIWELE